MPASLAERGTAAPDPPRPKGPPPLSGGRVADGGMGAPARPPAPPALKRTEPCSAPPSGSRPRPRGPRRARSMPGDMSRSSTCARGSSVSEQQLPPRLLWASFLSWGTQRLFDSGSFKSAKVAAHDLALHPFNRFAAPLPYML